MSVKSGRTLSNYSYDQGKKDQESGCTTVTPTDLHGRLLDGSVRVLVSVFSFGCVWRGEGHDLRVWRVTERR